MAIAGIVFWSHTTSDSACAGDAPAALRETASSLPDDLALVVTTYVHDRSPVSISELNELLDRIPDWKKEFEQEREKNRASYRELLGFDPQDDKAWSNAGINLGKPVTAVLNSLDLRHPDLSENTLFVLLPGNMAAAEKTVRKIWENSTDSQLNALLHHNVNLPQPRLLAAEQSGPRLFLKQKSTGESERTLREFISTAAAHPLVSNPNFVACLRELPAQADTAGFVNLASILSTAQKDGAPEFLSTLHAACFSSSFEEQDAFVLLQENDILLQLRPGSESREFLARFDQPAAAVSFSIADLAGLGRAVQRALGDSRHDKSEQRFDFDSGDFDQFLKDSCGGILIYPDEQENHALFPFTYASFVRVRDPAAYQSLRAKHQKAKEAGPNEPVKQVFGQNVLSIDETHGSATALVGEYLIHGTAVAQIAALAKGSAKGWHPAIGGKSLLELQLPAASLFRYLARNESPDIQRLFHDKLDETISFIARVEGRTNGVRYHAEYHSVYAAIAKLAPELKALASSRRNDENTK